MSHKSDKASEQASPSHEPVNESHEGHSEDAESQEKSKYDRNGEHRIGGLIAFTVLQFIALLLVVVATPIAMFKLNDTWRDKLYPTLTTSSKRLCVTAWGMKLGCASAGYYNRDFTNTFCYRVRVNFKIVEAFCIMTIAFMVFGLIMGILSIFQKVGKGATGSIGTFAMVMCIIPWGIVAGMYNQKPCCETLGWNDAPVTDCRGNNTALGEDVPSFKQMGVFGPGFGLLVAAWALQVIAIVCAFLPW